MDQRIGLGMVILLCRRARGFATGRPHSAPPCHEAASDPNVRTTMTLNRRDLITGLGGFAASTATS